MTSGSTPEIATLVDEVYNSVLINGTHKAPSIKVAEASKIIESLPSPITSRWIPISPILPINSHTIIPITPMNKSDDTKNMSGKRVAKNTLVLYVRTFITLLISLYTSRITLQVLGIDDYGIQAAVAGAIALFNSITNSISSSISRFITFELGAGNKQKLNRIFCTSMNLQLLMALLEILIMETIGLWFLNTQMNIPPERMVAANWVFHCAVLSFALGLLQIPYMATLIGREQMKPFAYFGILESILRLVIVLLLLILPFDKLIAISILGIGVSFIILLSYHLFCRIKFAECRYRFMHDKSLMKEMSGFASWNFLTNATWVINSQGVNILLNIFFGVRINAAQGIAAKLESICKKFIFGFMTALNPQITKSYAAGEMGNLFKLVLSGGKFSYFLMFCICLPLMFETDTILHLWLGNNVPEYTTIFFHLSIVATLIQMLGNTVYYACMATGKIRKYSIATTAVQIMVFPFTWFAFKLGMKAESTYIIAIVVYIIYNHVGLVMAHELINLPVIRFYKDVIIPIVMVTVIAIILPLIMKNYLTESLLSSLLIMFICIISAFSSIYLFGLTNDERQFVKSKINNKFAKL